MTDKGIETIDMGANPCNETFRYITKEGGVSGAVKGATLGGSVGTVFAWAAAAGGPIGCGAILVPAVLGAVYGVLKKDEFKK